MSKYCFKIIIEYDGSEFCGWQIQPAKRSVQQVIINAIKKFTREDIKLEGAGRTDAGVHAIGQVGLFCLDKLYNIEEILYRLNRLLPDDIAIKKVTRVPPGFDPRRMATQRVYRYYITETPQPLIRNRCHEIHRKLDIHRLNKSARLFPGRHDFTSFCKQKSLKDDNHCRIVESRWFRHGGLLIYEVKADRFLHHMVRRLVGAMLAYENLKINLTQLKAFLNNTSNVKYSVPANGLVLINVSYRRERR